MHPAGTELVWAAPGPTIDPDAVAEVPIYAGWSGISNSSHQPSLSPAARNRLQALGMPPAAAGGTGIFYTSNGDSVLGPHYPVHIHPAENIEQVSVQGQRRTVWESEAGRYQNPGSGTTFNFGTRTVFPPGPSETDHQAFATQTANGFGPGGRYQVGSFAIMIEAERNPERSTVYFYDARSEPIGSMSLGEYLRISQN